MAPGWQLTWAGVLCSLALSAAACGGSDHDAVAPGSSPPADTRAAAAALDQYRVQPGFTPPGPAFDAASALAGKTIYEIPITSEIPFATAVEEGMEQASEMVGAKLVVLRNRGNPVEWVEAMRTAIAQRADAITLLAQDPALLGPQIEQAEAAGIPVVVVRTTSEGESCPAQGAACVPGPFEQAGRLEADWAISRWDGRADVLVITSNDALSTAPLLRGLRDEFATKCPGCRLRYVDVPIARWAERIQSEVQSALVADPQIGFVIPIYDSMAQFAVPAILAAGATGRVTIGAFNGTPFVLAMVQQDDVVAMDVGENPAWIGWGIMDQVFRVVAGVGPVPSEHTPLRVFDDANVDETGRPPEFALGYGDSFTAGYRRLWGVAA